MGEEAQRDEELAVVNLEHAKRISDTFRPNKVKKKGSIPKTAVQEIWKNRLAPRFFSTMTNVMFPEDSNEVSFLSFYTIYKNLAEPEAEIMFRALTIYHIATIHEPPFNYEQADEYPNAPFKNIKDYVCDVITSYLHAIIHINMKEVLGWLELRASSSIIDGNLVAAYLLKDLEAHRNEVSIGSLGIWLEKNEIYYTVSEQLYLYLFGVNKSIDVKSLIPFPIVQTGKNSKTLLSVPDVLLLNSKLPKRAPKWTLAFLFDSRTSGDWETFKQIIYGRGQTLMVIQDSNGDIFGMYGSQQWFPSSGFYGNDQSFLFTLKPEVNVYESSGRNNNYQIFTESGIGMGGTEDQFGLFINRDTKTGSTSLSCSTFRQFWPLARELTFKIEQFELWIVNEDPVTEAVEFLLVDANGEEEKLDLISEYLDLSKLTNDFSKPQLTEVTNSTKMAQQGGTKMKYESSQAQKVLKVDEKPTTSGENVTKNMAEETKIGVIPVVQEAMQRKSNFSKGETKSKRVVSAEAEPKNCEVASVNLFEGGQIRRCIPDYVGDVQRSLTTESKNIKAPFEKQGFEPPPERHDDSVGHTGQILAAGGSFLHTNIMPKREPAPETPKKQQTTTRQILKKAPTKNVNDSDDITMMKYPNKRNGKSLVDVQIQVGNHMKSPKCRLSSIKHCACAVKSPCYCATVKPAEQNINDSSTIKLPSKPTISNVSSKTSRLRIIVPPSKDEGISSIDQVQPSSSTDPNEDQESSSALGCRCSSSTETSSDWEGSGVANTLDRLKLKSECHCKTVGKIKEASSSVCSCVLGPKDKGILNSPKETLPVSVVASDLAVHEKETQDLTRSCRKSFTSSKSREYVMRKSVTPKSSDDEVRFPRLSGKETANLTSPCRKSSTPSNQGGSIEMSKLVPPRSYGSTDGFFRFSTKESQHVTKPCESNASLKFRTRVRRRNCQHSHDSDTKGISPPPEEQSLSTDLTKNTSLVFSNTSPTRSYQKNNISLESRRNRQLSNTAPHILGGKPQISQEKQLGNESRPSCNKKTQQISRSSKKSESLKPGTSTTFNTSIPPTCLTCRSMVKTSGCKCQTRSSAKLTPIVEQASELLKQHRHSDRSSIWKSEPHSNLKNIRKGNPSAVTINIPETSINEGGSRCSCDVAAEASARCSRLSRYSKCSGNKDESAAGKCFRKAKIPSGFDNSQKETIAEISTISKSNDLPGNSATCVKKACQCSLPRYCFPQFPEDGIQADNNSKSCGCGTHADAVIRFPKFLEPEDHTRADITSHSQMEGTSESVVDTEGSSKGKKGQGVCPCSDEDGTIIILNVAKCNTMEALQKIVQELDVKYHPIIPHRIPLVPPADSESKSCIRREVLDSDAIKRMLDNKTMGPPKEQSELKVMPPPE